MYKKENNFFDKPTKQHIIIVGIIWLLIMAFLVNNTTNSFSENPFKYKNSIPVAIMFIVTIFSMKLYHNYKYRRKP